MSESAAQQISTRSDIETTNAPDTTSDTGSSAEDTTRKTAAVNNSDDNQIAELEFLIKQLMRRQQAGNSENTLEISNDRSGSDNRVKRLERVIARMDRRINSIESSSNGQNEMVDQLYEIQDYIDQVLDQLGR